VSLILSQVLLNTLGLASTTAVTPHGTYHAFDSRPAKGPGLADRPLIILHGMFTAASSMVCVRVCKCDFSVRVSLCACVHACMHACVRVCVRARVLCVFV
jgi:hypothetical protein